MTELRFRVSGEPVSWKRSRGNFHGKARFFVDPKTKEQKRRVEMAAKAIATRTERSTWKERSVRLTCVFRFSIPKSWPKWKREGAVRGDYPHRTKPDVDNLVKLVKDALNDVVWRDDTLVAEIHALKKYTDGEPSTDILIQEIPVERL